MEMFLLVLHIIIIAVMVLLILIQKSSTDSLSGLSGNASNPGAVLNVRGSGNFLTKTTAILAIGFMSTSLLLAINANHKSKSEVLEKIDAKQVAPAAKPAAPVKLAPQVPVAD